MLMMTWQLPVSSLTWREPSAQLIWQTMVFIPSLSKHNQPDLEAIDAVTKHSGVPNPIHTSMQICKADEHQI